MPEVELADGTVVEFPDSMSPTEVQARARAITDFRQQHGRLPAKVSAKDQGDSFTAEGQGPERPKFKNVGDVATHGMKLVRGIKKGELDFDKLPDYDQLAALLANRQIKPSDLTPELKDVLGLPTSVMEKVRGAGASIKRGFEGSGEEGYMASIGRAGRRAHEAAKGVAGAPTEELPVTGKLSKAFEGTPVGKFGEFKVLGQAERALMLPFSAAVAASHPDPKQQEMNATLMNMGLMRAVPGEAGVAGPALPGAGRAARETLRQPFQATPEPAPPPTAPRAPLALPEGEIQGRGVRGMGGQSGFEILDAARQTRSQLPAGRVTPSLPSGEAQRALPAGGQGRVMDPAEVTRSMLPEGEVAPKPLALPTGAPDAADFTVLPPKSSRTETVGGQQTGFDILEQYGKGPSRPPGAPSRPPLALGTGEGGPPAELQPPPGATPPTGGSTTTLPGVPRPTGRVQSATDLLREVSSADPTVDPGALSRFVTKSGGIKPVGDAANLPARLKNPRGKTAAELAEALSEQTGRPISEGQLLDMLGKQREAGAYGAQQTRRTQQLRGAEAASLEQQAAEATAEKGTVPPAPPEHLGVSQADWDAMPTPQKKAIVDAFGKIDPALLAKLGAGGLGAGAGALLARKAAGEDVKGDGQHPMVGRLLNLLGAALAAAPMLAMAKGGRGPRQPSEPFFEKTKIGDQAVIPGAEGRNIPQGALQAGKAQRPVGDLPLFAQEATSAQPGLFDAVKKEPAPVAWMGHQQLPGGRPAMELWNLTRDIPGHPIGSTVSRDTLEAAGFEVPKRPSPPPGAGGAGQAALLGAGGAAAVGGAAAGASDSKRQEFLRRLGLLGGAALAAAPMVAGLIGGKNPGEAWRTPPNAAGVREYIGPPPPKGPAPPRVATPEMPAAPGPFAGVTPSVTDGSALRGLRDLTKSFASTILGRFEGWGPSGKEVSRLIQRVTNDTETFYGKHGTAILDALHRLSDAEKENFRLVAEGQAEPMNAKVAAAKALYDPVFGPQGVIPTEAQKRNIMQKFGDDQVQVFRPREQFFPREFDPAFVREVLQPGSQARERAIGQLAERQGVDADTAAVMLDEYFHARITRAGGRIMVLEPDRFVGGLERLRELDIDGYITNPETAVGIRLWKVARRFAEIDHYGLLDAEIGHHSGVFDPASGGMVQKPAGLIGDIQQGFGAREAEKAYIMFKRVVGKPPEATSMELLARRAMSVEAFTKLPLSFVVNLTQPSLTALRTGILNASRGYMEAVFHPRASAAAARELGTIADMSMREFYADLAGEGRTGKLLNAVLTPFNVSEKWNRITASNAGRAWAGKIDGWLTEGRRGEWMVRELERLNFTPREIASIKDQGKLSPADRERVAWSIVDQTQFLEKRARRSEFFSSSLGQAVGQFKGFSINTGRLMHQMVGQEALRNRDPRALASIAATLGLVFPIVGELGLDVRSALRGRSRDSTLEPEDLPRRLVEDFFAVGGFGLATDFLQAAGNGRRAVVDWLAGPALSDAGHAVESAVKLATAPFVEGGNVGKELHDTGRFLARQVPFVGPQLSEAMRTDHKAAADAEKTWQQRLGIDPIESRLRKAEAEERQRKGAQARANQLAAEGRYEDAQDVIEAWNNLHEARANLSPSSIQRRRAKAPIEGQDPLQRRVGGLPPAARARVLRDLQELR